MLEICQSSIKSSIKCYQKELDHATGADIFGLAAKKDFNALKAEVDKLDINKNC